MGQSDPDKSRPEAIALNQALIDNLKKGGLLQTPAVEAAFHAVLRHQFLPGISLDEAYSDHAISVKQDERGQWLSSSSQPAMMAIMLEQLGLVPGHNVLEIGTGTGFNAALMAHIVGEAGHIVTVEIDEDLAQAARQNLANTGVTQVQVVSADGGYGYPDAAPYDRIILTVGAPDITPAWWSQLKGDGRIVLPLVLKGSMESIAFEKVNSHLTSLSVRDCSFIQLRGDFSSIFLKTVQIGPDPNLSLEPIDELVIDSDGTYDLLIGESQDWAANVEVRAWEALLGNLWTWLALREPHLCKLVARGDMFDRNIVPPLMGMDGKQKFAGTAALVDRTSLAILMRPPGEAIPLAAPNKPSDNDIPFQLFVRQFGPDESIAQRFIHQIQAWDASGRPASERMHILAYPKDSEYLPVQGEFVIEKQWTKLVIEWPASVQLSS